MEEGAWIWEQACAGNDLGPILERIARDLAATTPLAALLLRRIDARGTELKTIGAVRLSGRPLPSRNTSTMPGRSARAIAEWFEAGEPRLLRYNRVLPPLIPAGLPGDAIAAPLRVAGEATRGVLLLIARPGREFSAADLHRVEPILPALAAALQRDTIAAAIDTARRAGRESVDALAEGPLDITETIVGERDGLGDVMERVALVAPTDAPVLILGETGSGKEVIARAIHARSRRAAGPVLRVNCGAISPDLVDAELFGHERGSFTGAVAERKGWFERADGGTLFLDEIGELTLAAQIRLLRVLQDGTFERVGGETTRTVDVRIVAATHRDLPRMIAEGRFRHDLWFRVGVFPIVLPALRQRMRDLPDLAAHFARQACARLGAAPLHPDAADLAQLAAYAWPGNVRELAAVIERAVILGGGRRLEIRAALGPVALPALGSVTPPSPAARPPDGLAFFETVVAGSSLPGTSRETPFPTLDEAIAQHIVTALERTRGRIDGPRGAAALLGLNPQTLRSKLKKLEIDWQRFR